MNPLIIEHVAHTHPHTNTKLPTVFTLLGAIFYAYLSLRGGHFDDPLRVRKNDLCPLGIQIGKAIFNQPLVHLGTAGGRQAETLGTAGQTCPCCWCFLSPYKVQVHYRGVLCVGYSCSVGCSSIMAEYSISMAFFSICALLVPAFSANSCTFAA